MEKKERPILFSAPMVRAILEGKKTQTRRIVKPHPTEAPQQCHYSPSFWAHGYNNGCSCKPISCPYAASRLWVRETWAKPGEVGDQIEYRADNADPLGARWRPSIHMPRKASRINLEVTLIRIERLQDITEADARAEGVGPLRADGRMENGLPATDGYADLWESINGAGSWELNPWVWVVEFKREVAA